MRTITALKVQKRKKERVNVFLDDQFAFGLALILAAKLKVGQTLTSEQIVDLQQQDSFEKGKQAAIRFISYRPRSVAEVKRNLFGKGYHENVIAEIIDRLHSLELLDDESFARYWVDQRETFKPRGHFALRRELQQKGISQDIIICTNPI